jgi:hypothetical protein
MFSEQLRVGVRGEIPDSWHSVPKNGQTKRMQRLKNTVTRGICLFYRDVDSQEVCTRVDMCMLT